MKAWEKVEVREFDAGANFEESIRNSFQNCFVIFNDNYTSIAVNYVDTNGQLKFDYVTTWCEDSYKAYEDLKEKVLEKSRMKHTNLLMYYKRLYEEYKFLSSYNNDNIILHDDGLYCIIAKLYEYLNELEKNKEIGICVYGSLINLISQCVGLREKKFDDLSEYIESILG